MKNHILAIVLLFFYIISSYGQNRWAFIIGLSEYRNFRGKLPTIRYAENDAYSIAKLLKSDFCRFDPDRVFLITGNEVTDDNIRRIMSEKLSQTSSEDFIFILFIGHGIFKDDSYYLLLKDSLAEYIPQTSVSLKEFGSLLDTYVKANNLFVCIDANRSEEALDGNWYTGFSWITPIINKKICVLQASAP